MKTKQKEMLCRARPELLRALDVGDVLPALRTSGYLSGRDESKVMAESARRKRVSLLLDLLEKMKTEAFDVFADALADKYTHLYLQLTGFEHSDDVEHLGSYDDADEWANLRRARTYLIEEVDSMKIAPDLLEKQVINEKDFKEIREAGDTEQRTECLLDILELKPPSAVDTVIDTIGDSYPHLYLILTGDSGLDDDLL